jgi:hypothetical protein
MSGRVFSCWPANGPDNILEEHEESKVHDQESERITTPHLERVNWETGLPCDRHKAYHSPFNLELFLCDSSNSSEVSCPRTDRSKTEKITHKTANLSLYMRNSGTGYAT